MLQLVDPSSRKLASAIEDVIDAAPDNSGLMARELFQNCADVRTPVFSNVGELAGQLPALRRGYYHDGNVGLATHTYDKAYRVSQAAASRPIPGGTTCGPSNSL